MRKWIDFKLSETGEKTNKWIVVSKEADSGIHLGIIKWYGPWRKYSFFPNEMTVFEQDCLRDIAYFIELKTKEHREKKRE